MDEAEEDLLFNHCAATVRSLLPALLQLEREAALLQPVPLVEREWFELLRQKLIPQLGEQAFLVVAVVGGPFGDLSIGVGSRCRSFAKSHPLFFIDDCRC